ncbi:MAG: glutamine synthetase type III [Proteobacteria bacterium]|nr:glutamine synthetase type III [Pseudomonadota bacterium]MCP4921852.1 glutamine synthetase type III [Pseudomonadota bacterium]
MSASARFDAIKTANSRSPRVFQRALGEDGQPLTTADLFGRNTFSLELMSNKLPKPVFKRVEACISRGESLSKNDADVVAHAVKEWALDNGVTHFTHWFQPMTGSTAEKHDAFLTFSGGQAVERFTGDMLIQSEPDASSFPSGGTRTTFEARGYTAWDPSSPMFIMDNDNGKTLCIPSAFVSYTGEALDKKTPLLRSMQAINKSGNALLKALGMAETHITPTLGCEQEYFLIDRAYWALRSDLAIGGRTVVGAPPPKGQSLDDHYFGSINARVQAFMHEIEQELYKLGVPAKTRHNEVAPCQFELAPVFREANVGVDHNQLIMEILRRVAPRHGFKVLLHEKPFADINGSGKHNNWSLSDTNGDNWLEPGDSPNSNVRFLALLSSILLGVHRYQGVLRAAVASHGNDFRLGANEAPPAIISCFLGALLTRICDALAAGDSLPANPDQAVLELGVNNMPDVAKDNTDRNRTSPLAFTGNKFEFRAVGSTQNPAWPVTVLNTVVAEGMDQVTAWTAEAGGGTAGALKAIGRAVKESAAIRFEGDGYSDAWVEEAARRGLKNLRKTPEALDELRDDAVVKLFASHGVFSPKELEARHAVLTEQYVTAVLIEADTLKLIVDESILHVGIADRAALAGALDRLLELQGKGIDVDTSIEVARFEALSTLVKELGAARAELDTAQAEAGHDAHLASTRVVPALERIRAAVDSLEGVVDDKRWPLPKYREMLFLV